MILALLILQMKMANQTYNIQTKWKTFCERHLIDWDRDDPATKKWLDEQEEKENKNKTDKDTEQ